MPGTVQELDLNPQMGSSSQLEEKHTASPSPDREDEAWSGGATCPTSTASGEQSQDLDPGFRLLVSAFPRSAPCSSCNSKQPDLGKCQAEPRAIADV